MRHGPGAADGKPACIDARRQIGVRRPAFLRASGLQVVRRKAERLCNLASPVIQAPHGLEHLPGRQAGRGGGAERVAPVGATGPGRRPGRGPRGVPDVGQPSRAVGAGLERGARASAGAGTEQDGRVEPLLPHVADKPRGAAAGAAAERPLQRVPKARMPRRPGRRGPRALWNAYDQLAHNSREPVQQDGRNPEHGLGLGRVGRIPLHDDPRPAGIQGGRAQPPPFVIQEMALHSAAPLIDNVVD